MAHTYTSLLMHVVFGTKERRPDIDAELQARLYPYIGGVAREIGVHMPAIGGVADHVHLLLSLPPAQALADVLRTIKANSSKWVHETWPERSGFAWQTGYGAFSVSRSDADRVRRYIANQAEHHRRQSFQEEFVALLERHEIPYDERTLWE